jgi:hypothetical protein
MALTKITNGGVAASGMPQGGIIQVKHTQFTGTNTVPITADTDTVLSDLTVNITPISTSSIIHLQAHIFCEHGTDSSVSWNHVFFFYRDTTKLAHPTAGSRPTGISMTTRTYDVTNDASTPEIARYDYFDSPATTSQITYKCGIRTQSSEDLFINRTADDNDDNGHERGTSIIIATEIAG